ncbi:uncharacterized protein SRS1_10427 [Sporisorium reilianum f. sp. reilianum]|uniref:Uncharacterized protein n=1 Tax=Sporisorium reilianum f. sp. reilianum TaxID=72559 RepID=A0A2N8U9L5_9BASI|nr:uncharacterized protein SRS1_10427 [Sporisorium reilianum f. sp. reilianum]
MGLINLLLKAAILVLDLRDTYHALDAVKLDEIGRSERQVLVRNAEDGTKHLTSRKRVGTSKRKAAVKSALTTVLVWNLFAKLEPLSDRTIAWFVPFYDSFKTLLLIWMLFTRSYGASILVFRLLAPMIRPYESVIDGIFGLAVSLLAWIATLLAPTVERCTKLAHTLGSVLQQNTEPRTTSAVPASSGPSRAPQRKTSTTSLGRKAGKKPPPPSSPPASIKASPASASSSSSAVKIVSQQQPNVVAANARQALSSKASNGSLAATRRVLQELPVPSHAFDSVQSQASASTSSPASQADKSTSGLAASHSVGRSAGVKTEPSEPNLASPAAALGAPPTPPTGLQNYAFIPGLTPQRSGPASLASPTPRFPGGFAFSAAGPTSANPFQAPARVPLTAQMAPLSLSSQIAAPLGGPHLLGSQNGAPNSALTHDSVASARDDRIVPPPNSAAVVRKVSSVRSLKGKAAAKSTMQKGGKAAAVSNAKKRARSDDAAGDEVAEAGEPKRVKSVAGQVATSKKAAGSVTTARARAKKATATNGVTGVTSGSSGTRNRDGANGTTSTAIRKANASARPASASTSTPADGNSTTGTAGSTEGKPKAAATNSPTASTKPTAQRTAAKKAPSTSKSRSQSTEAAEATEPPQRLTRSRTKQNLAD